MVASLLLVVLIAGIAGSIIVLIPDSEGESIATNFNRLLNHDVGESKSHDDMNGKYTSWVDTLFNSGVGSVKTVVDGADIDQMNLPTGLNNEGKDKIFNATLDLSKNLKNTAGSVHEVTDVVITENIPSKYHVNPEVIFVIALMVAAGLFFRFWKVILHHLIIATVIIGIAIVLLIVYQIYVI